ncbi:parallel beta-helix domain-containing protein [Sinimarinibacterium flocculans]|uniref:Parallel beta-helix repeat protein n=1 Tax=Sinimarinibacterium flocculans TaxID=985250 RepID=A0A318EH15_9GAMM|nr:parallel beta-helix domain-containing protein [Sinimarinibacterium flocculans]PXV71230.1 parallel beta-helix repeat protein [Sinimarinibacterium flocculans]
MQSKAMLSRGPAGWVSALAMVLTLAACGGGSSSDAPGPGPGPGPTPGPEPGEGRTFVIEPNADATTDMIAAMIQALPGDVIEFGCGYFELSSALQLTNTEDVTIRGCGRDATVLSFKTSNTPEGILAVNVHGLWIEDLTVLDTGGNGIELRGVDHARLQRVRAIWSSGGGRESATPITADNAFANDAALLNVACTDPATLNPDAPENQLPGLDTTSPDYTVSPKSGRYGIYPVASENILVDDAESVGASDAGIYVGQTNNAIIRNSRAAYNVFGFEIENVRGGEYANNLAECNTGGFLIYDLDGLRQYGDRSRMYGNTARNNNTYNFTSGGIVGSVPPGSGMITLSYDRIEIFDNLFENNNTAGIIHASYELFPEGAGRPVEKRIDWYTEGLYIHGNRFVNNGNGLPRPTTTDLANGEVARVLPALVGLKNAAACLNPLNLTTCLSAAAGGGLGLQTLGYRGAHIIWDGLLDSYDADCPYPVDANGNPVPKDERGKPLHTNDHPNPSCHYNAYKFNTAAPDAPRIVPDWFASCIDADNDFSDDSLKFARFNGTKGLEVVIAAATADLASGGEALVQILSGLAATDLFNFASSFDTSAHECPTAYGRNLQPLPAVVIPPFERSGNFDPAPSEEEVRALCEAAVADGAANFAAAAVNCPTLDQYALFADPEDPTSAPRGNGVPFVLNTKLFSDYAVKYRVAYLPPGAKATYRDGITDGVNATISFPVGTIIAKTFAFADDEAGTEVPVETRLLIKRRSSRGLERWDGVPYIWTTENDGRRVARLAMGGGTRAVSWQYTDLDSGALHSGSTAGYQIPHANQCLSCHANEDADTGSAPIGPRIRNLNRRYASETLRSTGQSMHEVKGRNQIAYWCESGRLAGCPSDLGVDPQTGIATKLERLPVFNKPGDAGYPAGSGEDIEARARAYLEVNCQYCHNPRGFAGSTGLYLDVFRAVNESYGICKRPTATGQEGNGGRTYDIHPGNVGDSILPFRIGPDATTPAARMPPIARSVSHAEGHALIEQWIREVVVKDESRYPGSTSCTGD